MHVHENLIRKKCLNIFQEVRDQYCPRSLSFLNLKLILFPLVILISRKKSIYIVYEKDLKSAPSWTDIHTAGMC